jgi:hypothetical protein
MESVDSIKLTCPVCQQPHEFHLSVEKSPVLYNMLSATLEKKAKAFKSFRCLFTCPTKNEPFQATIRIEEQFGELIHGVKVIEGDAT